MSRKMGKRGEGGLAALANDGGAVESDDDDETAERPRLEARNRDGRSGDEEKKTLEKRRRTNEKPRVTCV